MNQKVYITQKVCAKKIIFDYDDEGNIHNLKFEGGCNGNLKAISLLCEGKPLKEVQKILEGNTCGPRPTSCADQLAEAIKEVINNA